MANIEEGVKRISQIVTPTIGKRTVKKERWRHQNPMKTTEKAYVSGTRCGKKRWRWENQEGLKPRARSAPRGGLGSVQREISNGETDAVTH